MLSQISVFYKELFSIGFQLFFCCAQEVELALCQFNYFYGGGYDFDYYCRVAKFNTIPIKILVSIRIIQVFVVGLGETLLGTSLGWYPRQVSSFLCVYLQKQIYCPTALTTINAIFVCVVCVTVVQYFLRITSLINFIGRSFFLISWLFGGRRYELAFVKCI